MTMEQAPGAFSHIGAPDVAKMSEIQVQNFVVAQREIWGLLEQVRQGWLELAQTEAKLVSEFATGLSSCKTVPEIMKVYQDGMTKQTDLMVQDSQRLLADGQKLMASMAMVAVDGAKNARG